MGDRRQIDTLKQGVTAWNEWREKNPTAAIELWGNPGELSGRDLSGINLRQGRLTFQQGQSTKFCNADLQGARLLGHRRFNALHCIFYSCPFGRQAFLLDLCHQTEVHLLGRGRW